MFAEIYKFIQNYNKDWQLYLWRTKEKEEIDFLIITEKGEAIALDAKLSMQNVQPEKLPNSFKKMFPKTETLHLVTFGGEPLKLSKECQTIPIGHLHDYLASM